MEKKKLLNIMMTTAGVCVAVAAAILAGLLCFGAIETFAAEDLKEGNGCSFVVPKDFMPGKEKGLFVNKNYPMESSIIQYSYYENGLDNPPTNRQKIEMAEKGETLAPVADQTKDLTKAIYEETISAAYNSEYGKDVGFKVNTFGNVHIDGYPAYRIEATYQAGDEERIHQTVYMVLSKYKTFVITYQRAEDDDCQELFEQSQKTIHVQ